MNQSNSYQKSDDFYDILELKKDCTPQDIKKQYHKLALKWHPDKQDHNQNTEIQFMKVQEAYSTLSDQRKRRVYDKYGKEGLDFQEECTKISKANNFSDFFKNDYGSSNLSGFEVLKNILQDKKEENSESDGFSFFQSSRLKSFIDDNILSTDSEDENDFCSFYKPTFLNSDFVSSTDKLGKTINGKEEKSKTIFEDFMSEKPQRSSFSFLMNSLKKGYSKNYEETGETFDDVFIESNYFSSKLNPKVSTINTTYIPSDDEEDEKSIFSRVLNSNSKRIKKENIPRVK